jgi:hypothetical protein
MEAAAGSAYTVARGLTIVLMCVPGLVGSLTAQGVTTAALRGRVVDSQGDPVPDAQVSLEHRPSGFLARATTDRDGQYYLPSLRPGDGYSLTVSRLGFATVTRDGLSARIGQVVVANIVVRTEAVAVPELEVTVRGDPVFDPSRIGITTRVDERTLESLPTLSRNFVDFVTLSPHVRSSETGISVAGSNVFFNNVQVDGALNQDVFGLSPNGVAGGRANGRIIPLEAIEQLEVSVSPYDVRQSGFTGGVLNAVTKSGTNELTGSAFAFFRDEVLIGNLVVDDVSRRPEEFTNLYAGFTLAGPIVKDRAHFFLAGEWERLREPPDGFHVGESDPLRTGLSADSVARFEGILRTRGADPGLASSYTLDNTIANAFARVDWMLSDRHKAIFRYSFASADDDVSANRLPGDAYEMSNVGTRIETQSHSAVAQLFSTITDRVSNELFANVQFSNDVESGLADYPRIEVQMAGALGGEDQGTRRLRAGSNLFGDSKLEQSIVEISDNLRYTAGSHQLLGGASLRRFGIRRSFLPVSRGAYRFASLAAFESNLPDSYDVTVPLREDAAVADFSVVELAAYLQDEWRVSDRLNIRFGVRIDAPFIPGRPTDNPAIEEDFGIRTSELPSGNLLISPRAGFNWLLSPDGGTQVRGGAGLFTGRPAFAWLANAFQNTGLDAISVLCEGALAPPFDPTAPPPTTCNEGSGPEGGERTANVYDSGFRFPQDFRTSLAIDQKLPFDFLGSLTWVYSKAVHQVVLRDLNGGINFSPLSIANGFTDGFGYVFRQAFGAPNVQGFDPIRLSDRFGPVLKIGNGSESFAYGLSAELARSTDRLALRAGYSFTRSGDTQSLITLDANTNFGFNPIESHPNSPKRQPSLFDRPHKVVASATARILEHLGGTEITLLYIGQSGAPYSYVYQGDVNGDGFPGPGRATDLNNDLIYIPELISEFPGFIGSAIIFQSLVDLEECLRDNVVRTLFRNGCRTPWSNELDLRLSQTIRAGNARVQVVFDVLNLLNLLNDDWGLVRTVNPIVPVLRVARSGANDPLATEIGVLRAFYSGPRTRAGDGSLEAALPTVVSVPSSQWQAQLGVRVTFGGRR